MDGSESLFFFVDGSPVICELWVKVRELCGLVRRFFKK